MNLDPRLPMGMMFSILGAILLAFGMASRNRIDLYARGFGINADVWWGAAILIFGLIVVAMGRRGQGRIEQRKSAHGKSAGAAQKQIQKR